MMGKYRSLGIGAGLGAAGLILMVLWWGDFVTMLKGLVPVVLVLCGAIALIAGFSEIKDEKNAKEKSK